MTEATSSTITGKHFPITLDRAVTIIVLRPKKSRIKREKEEEEVLVIEGIEVKRDVFVKFDVFINDQDHVTSGPEKTEFAGSFVNMPHKHRHGDDADEEKKMMKTKLRLGISELLEDLGAEDDDQVLVTLVPRCENCVVTIYGGIEIQLEN